jgi:hypothetical protein
MRHRPRSIAALVVLSMFVVGLLRVEPGAAVPDLGHAFLQIPGWPEDKAKLVPGIAYRLQPINISETYRWIVASDRTLLTFKN